MEKTRSRVIVNKKILRKKDFTAFLQNTVSMLIDPRPPLFFSSQSPNKTSQSSLIGQTGQKPESSDRRRDPVSSRSTTLSSTPQSNACQKHPETLESYPHSSYNNA